MLTTSLPEGEEQQEVHRSCNASGAPLLSFVGNGSGVLKLYRAAKLQQIIDKLILRRARSTVYSKNQISVLRPRKCHPKTNSLQNKTKKKGTTYELLTHENFHLKHNAPKEFCIHYRT